MTGLAPILFADTHVLILGSFPSAASLAAGQYYAHPRNQFWRLLSAVLGEELVDLAYLRRLRRLKAHHIGLWDVINACERQGSLDAAIRRPRANEFASLQDRCPRLERVCFNGQTAGKFAPPFAEAGFATLVLPSSSAANACWSFPTKLAVWRGIIG